MKLNKYKRFYNYSNSKNNIISNDESNLSNIEYFKDLTKTLPIYYDNLENSFSVFNSINNVIYIIYTDRKRSIVSYNLVDNKKINEIRNAHFAVITNFRHYLDEINKRDIVISISSNDNNIKLWDINYLECLLDLKKINTKGFVFSVCGLNDKNENYIVISNHIFGNEDPIKIYDFQGNKTKEITDLNINSYFIDSYYDNKSSTNYLITGNEGYVISYNYSKEEIYHEYNDNDEQIHCSVIIDNSDADKIKLMESSRDGNIRIWDFHTGELLHKIELGTIELYGICLWNKDFLCVGCSDKTIKIIDLNKKELFRSLFGHYNCVRTVKKIKHPLYEECLLSQGEQIKMWIIKKKK